MAEPEPLARLWRRRGRRFEIHGRRIFVLSAGEPTAGTIGVLHGFPSSSLDYHRVLPALAAHHRVVLHDHLGFGFSDKRPGDAYSLFEQAEYAIGVWQQLGLERLHLLAHDYGTSVATELLARRERGQLPIALSGVTLSNGSVLLELARLRLSQRMARSPRLGPLFGRLVGWRYFRRAMRGLWGDPARARDEDLAAIWSAIRHDDGQRLVHRLSSYLDERVRFRRRWLRALERLDLPVQLLWGRRDPVARAEIAERLATIIPRAELTWLEDCGHYPMLERPDEWSAAVVAFLGRLGELSPPRRVDGLR